MGLGLCFGLGLELKVNGLRLEGFGLGNGFWIGIWAWGYIGLAVMGFD